MASPGTLVEYFQAKRLVCALCLRSDNKDNLYVRTEDNREDKVAKGKLVFSWPSSGMSAGDSPEQVVERLRQASSRRDEVASSIALGELWELLVDEGQALELNDLGDLYFPSSPTPEQLSGLFRALELDRIYFQRKGQSYVPRSRTLVEESLQRLKAESERGQEKELIGKWLRALWNGQPAPVPEGFERAHTRYFTWIREVALQGNEASRFKDIQALFKELEIGGKDAAFKIMVKAGIWGEDEFLLLHRFHPPIEFTPELIAHAEAAAARLPELLADPSREDLRHLECITIDDEDTTEIDDALSLSRLEDGWLVGIHIADASAFVEPGSELDKEALERGTDIYLPEQKIRMLPEALGDHACSLVAGQDRLAFSFLVELDEQFSVRSHRMVRSKIHVRERLTYDQADLQLQDGCPWSPLLDISRALRDARSAAGAVTLPFPRTNIKVIPGPDGPDIRIVRESPNAPSQVVVSEMAILANRLAGEFCVTNGIAAFFRSQPAPEKTIPADTDFAPEVLFKLRRLFRRGEIGLEPARHSGLGLDAYIQATSPIRRYVDMLAQRQLKAVLSGLSPVYDRGDLERMWLVLERSTSQADLLERDRKQYWTLRYLEARRWAEMDAIVLQNQPDKHIVQIVPVLYECECPLVPGRPLPPGSRLKVRIELVWPREQTVRVTPVLDDDDD